MNFIRVVPDAGIITAGATVNLNLEAIKNEFGLNFNTILLKNKSDEEIILIQDGREAIYIQSSDGISWDWETNILFDILQLRNNSLTDTSINEIRISIGRTGVQK